MRIFLSTLVLSLAAFAAPAHAVLEDYPSIKLQGLDKSVGRTITFEAKVGSTIQYGPLFIKIHACRKAPPIETPESAAFLQIWEVPPGSEKSEWVFSGWMFASSPALSAMDHPVYDVWVLDCTGREQPNEEAAAAQTDEQVDQTSLPSGTAIDVPPKQDQEIPEDGEAEPESPADADAAETFDESQIPVDGEAEPELPSPQSITPTIDPNAPYSPSQYPSAPAAGQQYPSAPAPTSQYPNPADAPYNPPAPQGPQYAPAPVTPAQEGIYSPSQGRIVPAQPQAPYPSPYPAN